MTKKCTIAAILTALPLAAGVAVAQSDPGVQANRFASSTNPPPVAAISADSPSLAFFNDGLARFQFVEVVTNAGGNNVGLGPRFNANQCSVCHSQPTIGGTSPSTNPLSHFTGSGNVAPNDTTPFFETADGPVREARFPFFFNADGTVNTNAPNGGVESLFTITGRPDIPAISGQTACSLSQPSFAAANTANNIQFRIPTPVFGLGLIENLDDSTLLKNQATNNNNTLGISGAFNRNGNDGTIARFGWKAQNKSLHTFAGEAYNVEMGISNLVFPQDRPLPGEDQLGSGLPSNCLGLGGATATAGAAFHPAGYPEDSNNPGQTSIPQALDDVSTFGNFMRDLAPPPTGNVTLSGTLVSSTSIANGKALFGSVGCAACHNPTPGNTQPSNITGGIINASTGQPYKGAGSLGYAPVNAFSDIEIHHMGTGLADNISQGNAGGDQFRTAPLWGVGNRIFLLHDGRTKDLLVAIEAHASNGSEATNVETNFDNLSVSQKQDLLNFVRSL